jgi:PAS domain S-box-containing protein
MNSSSFTFSPEILEHFSEGLLLLDTEGRIIFWNKAMEEISGMKREAVLNRYHHELMMEFMVPDKRSDERGQQLRKMVLDLLKTGKGSILESSFQIEIITADGLRKNLLQMAFLLRTRRGGFNLGAIMRDITERVKGEEILKQSETRYRLLFESAHDTIFLMENDVFVDCNPKALDTFGCTREFLIGKHPWDISPRFQGDGSDTRKKAKELIGRTLDGISQTFEWIHMRSDGSTFEAEISLNRVTLEEKVFLQAVVRNVSKRNKANNQLRKFSQCLLNFGPDPEKNIQSLTSVFGDIISADSAMYNRYDGEMLYTTGKFRLPVDFKTIDQARGHLCFDVVSMNNREILLVRDLPNSSYYITDPNVTKYGLKTYIGYPVIYDNKVSGSLCAVFVRDFLPDEADKLILSMVASAIGVEEERLAEFRKLQESEKKFYDLSHLFQLMSDNVPDLLWAKDLEKKYLFANKALRELLLNTQDPEEPLGKTDNFFGQREKSLHPDNPRWHTFGDQCTDSDSLIMKEKQPRKFEESGYSKGVYRVFDMFKAPILNEHGEMIGTVGTARDVTREKEVEQKIRKYTEELQELNNTKDKFFSIISHDLKGPFNAILGFSEILTKEWDDFTDEERQHFVRNIYSSAQNTFKLLENLLAWTMAQSGRQQFNPFPVDMSVITNEMVILLRDQADKKNVRVFSSINFGTVVLADENMVRTIIRNLISNAIKFTPENGQVRITAENYSEDPEQKDWIEICVSDTGVGIPAENLGKLFRIDQQLRTAGTANEKGTGLGLILCKELIEKHGGKIWASSEEGKGSKFCFVLPKV